jgi:hypothetical protein
MNLLILLRLFFALYKVGAVREGLRTNRRIELRRLQYHTAAVSINGYRYDPYVIATAFS